MQSPAVATPGFSPSGRRRRDGFRLARRTARRRCPARGQRRRRHDAPQAHDLYRAEVRPPERSRWDLGSPDQRASQLYAGYVAQVNALNQELAELRGRNRASGKDHEFSELTRRLGFEYNGMILHEYYFSNLQPNADPRPAPTLKVTQRLAESFGSLEQWQADFQAIGGMRGIGWVILCQDPVTHRLTNHWVTLHHAARPSASSPCWSWTSGSMRSCATTRRPRRAATWRRSSGTSTGAPSSFGSRSPWRSGRPRPRSAARARSSTTPCTVGDASTSDASPTWRANRARFHLDRLEQAAPQPTEDWWTGIDGEILNCLAGRESMTPAEISSILGLSEGEVVTLLAMLAPEGRVTICRVSLAARRSRRPGVPGSLDRAARYSARRRERARAQLQRRGTARREERARRGRARIRAAHVIAGHRSGDAGIGVAPLRRGRPPLC